MGSEAKASKAKAMANPPWSSKPSCNPEPLSFPLLSSQLRELIDLTLCLLCLTIVTLSEMPFGSGQSPFQRQNWPSFRSLPIWCLLKNKTQLMFASHCSIFKQFFTFEGKQQIPLEMTLFHVGVSFSWGPYLEGVLCGRAHSGYPQKCWASLQLFLFFLASFSFSLFLI